MTTVLRVPMKNTREKQPPRSFKMPEHEPTGAEKSEARDKIVNARVYLLIKRPFFGNLATRLELVEASGRVSTAATDGRKFFYNVHFVNALSPEELVFLVGHELLHVAYNHMDRRGKRDRKISNIAADYCVNGDLVKHRIGKMPTRIGCLYDDKYLGWSYERVYEDLLENSERIDIDGLVDSLLDEHMEECGSEQERAQLRDEIREAILSASRSASPDEIPESLRKMISDFTDPKMDWQSLLTTTIQSAFKSDYTWLNPSRRGWHMDVVMPGADRERMIDIVCAFDASGSCITRIPEVISEVRGIMESFTAFRLHLLTFDTAVHNPQTFTPDNIDELGEYEIVGGGGTSFGCVYRYLDDNGIVPEKMVWLTDGLPCDSWGNPNFADTLWIIHTTDVVPPFGQYAYLEEE